LFIFPFTKIENSISAYSSDLTVFLVKYIVLYVVSPFSSTLFVFIVLDKFSILTKKLKKNEKK